MIFPIRYFFVLKVIFFTSVFFLIINTISAQNYTSYFTGDTTDIETTTQPGTVLMGGSTENDSAMVWWLKRSGGGDVLIIRASGSNGYNNYLYSELGQTVNSVESIVWGSRQNSYDPYILRRLKGAEALWIAGGDQGKYTSYWKNTPVDSLINYLIHVKKVPVGGTSAGMAIMGEVYFDALQGSVTSAEALANPYNPLVSIGRNDFIHNPILPKTITDTHFDNPDRRGRFLTFLARLATDSGYYFKGIACEEKAAVCIDPQGIGHVFGNNPATEFAYFVQANCSSPSLPEVCSTNTPLTWQAGGKALQVYKAGGTNFGTNTFNLNDWQTGSGGIWEYWSASNGVFSSTSTGAIPCITSLESDIFRNVLSIYPNPAEEFIEISGIEPGDEIRIWSSLGQIQTPGFDSKREKLRIENFPSGIYTLQVSGKKESRLRFVRK